MLPRITNLIDCALVPSHYSVVEWLDQSLRQQMQKLLRLPQRAIANFFHIESVQEQIYTHIQKRAVKCLNSRDNTVSDIAWLQLTRVELVTCQ